MNLLYTHLTRLVVNRLSDLRQLHTYVHISNVYEKLWFMNIHYSLHIDVSYD